VRVENAHHIHTGSKRERDGEEKGESVRAV
jgi:hypothetical protein